MASPTLHCLILLYLSSLFILPPSSSSPITLELSRKNRNPRNLLSEIAKASLKRAYHLRHRNKPPTSTSTPLYPISDLFEYVIDLSIGTPPQNLPVIFDTGSSLVWVPCTSNYSCTNCTRTEPNNVSFFMPRRSSSKNSVHCSDKKCSWLDTPSSTGSCPGCTTCGRRPCAYSQFYGSGSTVGHAISDKLSFQGKTFPDFLFGCSSSSIIFSRGIAGFGRARKSLPSQLGLNKFSYCLVSHNFDDTTKSSPLTLGDNDDNSGDVIQGIKYTPFVKNPTYTEYYYVHLERITVGKHIVKLLSPEILVPDSNGNGGTIVDSGSTFSAIDSTLFDPIMTEFMAQLTPAQRTGVEILESTTGNLVCVNVTSSMQRVGFPEIVFHFEGGVDMDVGVANYFNNGGNQLCLPFANSTIVFGQPGSGPAVIVGNYQQFDFHLEFDLKNQRFGVKRKNCDHI